MQITNKRKTCEQHISQRNRALIETQMIEFLKAVIFGFSWSNDFILSTTMASLGSEVLNSHVLFDMI